MPELPEVQAVCDGLNQKILNRVVEGINVREHRLRKVGVETFSKYSETKPFRLST